MWKSLKKGFAQDVQPEVIPEPSPPPYSPSLSMGEGPPEIRPPCRTPMGSYIVPEGGCPLTSLGNQGPGPADYLPKMDITKKGAPQYSLVGKPKKFVDKNIPGPFNYNTSGDITWKKKKVSLKGRGKSYFDEQAEKSITLLGKYKVEHLSLGKDGPKFKMGTRCDNNVYSGPPNALIQPADSKGFTTPGPNYRPNSSYWGRGPKKSFGDNWKTRKPKGPGPGDYDVKTTHRGTSHSFGIKLPEPVAVQQTVNKFSPAANTYDLGTTIGKAPAVSIAGRPEGSKLSFQTPCPSTYTLEYKTDNYKAKTLAYRWFEMDEPKKPGPSDYKVNHVNLKKNPSFSCRQRVKTSYPDSVTYDKIPDAIPGPGAYNPCRDIQDNDKPSYTLRKRLEPQVDKDHFPGPNAYIPEKQAKPGSSKAPSFSMAKRLVPPNSMKDTPGPGEYSPAPKQTNKGKYTMTSRPKGKGTFVNPASNKYTLPDLISGKKKGVVLKSRASPYVYSGFRTNKIEEPRPSVSAY